MYCMISTSFGVVKEAHSHKRIPRNAGKYRSVPDYEPCTIHSGCIHHNRGRAPQPLGRCKTESNMHRPGQVDLKEKVNVSYKILNQKEA